MHRQIEAVHPDLQSVASKIPRITFSSKNLWLWRFMQRFPWISKAPEDIQIENTDIPGKDNTTRVRLRIYRQKIRALRQAATVYAPVLLWLHGGGYIIGKPEQDDACCIQYARALGLVVVSVDYRLAPEYPFPSALEDSYAALKWVHANAGQLGVDAKRIAIGGASAGGGLAAALVQFAQDQKEVQPAFQLLVYPMLDDRSSLRTNILNPGNLTWNQQSNRFGWESYLGRKIGTEVVQPYSVPARRTDLSGFPPTWIGVGTLDLFKDEDVAYGEQLKACGVECEIYIVPGAFHGFDVAGPRTQVVQAFCKSQVAAMKRCLFLEG